MQMVLPLCFYVFLSQRKGKFFLWKYKCVFLFYTDYEVENIRIEWPESNIHYQYT